MLGLEENVDRNDELSISEGKKKLINMQYYNVVWIFEVGVLMR